MSGTKAPIGSIQPFRSLRYRAGTLRKIEDSQMSILNEQELNRYSISTQDFEKCIRCLQELDNYSPSSLVFESLLVCAVIYYCRPFSCNERGKNAGAIPRLNMDSFSDITANEKCLHSRCMTIRNKALAHSEWSMYPTRRKPETNVIVSQPYHILSEDIDQASLLTLATKLKEQCHHKRADYARPRPGNAIGSRRT